MRITVSLSSRLLTLALSVALAFSVANAQSAKEFEPQVGQEGKDVIWVPTPIGSKPEM
jgi:hypothetical protein